MMKLSLGPVLYYWPRQKLWDLYEQVARSPVDTVYLGETICPKRETFSLDEWIEIGRYLSQRDIEVVISSRVLIETDADRRALQRLCRVGRDAPVTIEANDMAAVQLLHEQRSPFVGGHGLNLYNRAALDRLSALGLYRWVMPLEMDRITLAEMLAPGGDSGTPAPETEVFAHGRMPLAHSARCFTARAHERSRDDCQHVCFQYPNGLELDSQEGEPVFRANGLQTQSGRVCNLLGQWPEMQNLGVDVLRFSAEDTDIADRIMDFYQALRTQQVPEPARNECNGYWFGVSGMSRTADEPATHEPG